MRRLVLFCDPPAPPAGIDPGRWGAVWRRLRADLDESVNDLGADLGELVLHVRADEVLVEARDQVRLAYGMDAAGRVFEETGVEQLGALLAAPPEGSVWCLWARWPRCFVAPVAVALRETPSAGERELLRARWRDEERQRERERRPWLGQKVTPRHLRGARR